MHLGSKDSHSLMQAWVAAEWGLVLPWFPVLFVFLQMQEKTNKLYSLWQHGVEWLSHCHIGWEKQE